MAIQELFSFSGTGHWTWGDSQECWEFILPQAHRLDVCVSVISSPRGLGGAPSANDFWTFCAILFYVCMQYASIIQVLSLELEGSKSSLQRQR